jgi:predicted transcriptional regulator YdeE
MQKTTATLTELKLVGITVRTNNATEMDPRLAKIGATMQRFFAENLQEKIINRKNPGKIFAVYTDYENDISGNYTYFIGEEVTSYTTHSEGLELITIPVQDYAKFTSSPGQMPHVVIDMWQQIWKMSPSSFGGERAYIADFEIYDERSFDPQKAVVDIYIGIKK